MKIPNPDKPEIGSTKSEVGSKSETRILKCSNRLRAYFRFHGFICFGHLILFGASRFEFWICSSCTPNCRRIFCQKRHNNTSSAPNRSIDTRNTRSRIERIAHLKTRRVRLPCLLTGKAGEDFFGAGWKFNQTAS